MARPVLAAIGTVAVAVVVVHVLFALAPGDAIDRLPNADSVRPVLEAKWHLDRPLPLRIAATWFDVARGDLGDSFSGPPVAEVMGRPLLRSLGWWLGAATLSSALSVAIGFGGRVARGLAIGVSAVPVFLLAPLVALGLDEATVAAIEAGWIARPGWFPLPLEPSALRWVLAVTVLATGSAVLSDGVGEVVALRRRLGASTFVRAARARGEPVAALLARHVALHGIRALASRAPVWLGGLVILEQVFLLDGAGRLLWESVQERDLPVAMGLCIAFAACVAAVRLAADGAVLWLDPRASE